MGVTSVYLEGNSHLGKNKTPQSKNMHGGSSFKGVHSKNSSTVRPNYSWGIEPPFHSPEKSQCTNMLQVKQLDCFCGTSLIGWKEFLVSIWGLSSSIPKFYVKSIVLIYIIHCVHHTSPQHKITAALLQVFPLVHRQSASQKDKNNISSDKTTPQMAKAAEGCSPGFSSESAQKCSAINFWLCIDPLSHWSDKTDSQNKAATWVILQHCIHWNHSTGFCFKVQLLSINADCILQQTWVLHSQGKQSWWGKARRRFCSSQRHSSYVQVSQSCLPVLKIFWWAQEEPSAPT